MTSDSSTGRPTRVMVIQPVIPAYRVGFFRRLVATENLDVEIHASERMPDGAIGTHASARDLPLKYHRIKQWLGCYWIEGVPGDWNLTVGDVVVVPGAVQYLNNLLIWRKARECGAGIVWWGQGWSYGSTPARSAFKRRAAGFADSILLYTEHEAEAYRKVGCGKPVFGANNCLDEEEIQTAISHWTEERLAGFQAQHGLQNRNVVLFSGRLSGKQNLSVLLRGLGCLAKDDPSCLLVVIGDGSQRPELERLAASLGIADHIRWVGALYQEEALAPWFLSAVCFAYPAPIGLSLIHALNYGLPVITHDQCLHHGPEIAALVPGANGLLFQEGNPRELADNVSRLCGDPALRKRLSRGARQTIHDHFNMGHMVSQMVLAIQAARNAALQRVERRARSFPAPQGNAA